MTQLWTEPEIIAYKIQQRNHTLLDKLYKNAKIPDGNPQERSELLAEKVLKLTPTDQDLILRISYKEGRAKGLTTLEDMTVEYLEQNPETIKTIY